MQLAYYKKGLFLSSCKCSTRPVMNSTGENKLISWTVGVYLCGVVWSKDSYLHKKQRLYFCPLPSTFPWVWYSNPLLITPFHHNKLLLSKPFPSSISLFSHYPSPDHSFLHTLFIATTYSSYQTLALFSSLYPLLIILSLLLSLFLLFPSILDLYLFTNSFFLHAHDLSFSIPFPILLTHSQYFLLL